MTLSEAALADLESRDWTGNVRELDNVLKAALARSIATGVRTLGPEHLVEVDTEPSDRRDPLAITPGTTGIAGRFQLVGPDRTDLLTVELGPAVEQVQRSMVEEALKTTGGNRPAAAARLGVSRQWLHTLLSRWREGVSA